MIYAGVQIYTNKEVSERQETSISSYARKNDMQIEEWLLFNKAECRKKLNKLKKGDVLLMAKLFRLGCDAHEIMRTLQELLDRGVEIRSCEDDLRFGNDMMTSVMSYCFGLAGDVARDVRALLTREALEIRKKSGKKMGRPAGSVNKSYKLDARAAELRRLLALGFSVSGISRRFNVNINTVRRYLKSHPEIRKKVGERANV